MHDILSTSVNLMPLLMVLITTIGMPMAGFLAKLGVGAAERLAAPYVGEATALLVQQRANELIDKGIGEAALHYLPVLQAKGLTIDTGSLLAARVADYCVNHAPDLADKMKAFEGSLEQKVAARLIQHPAVAAATAPAPVAKAA